MFRQVPISTSGSGCYCVNTVSSEGQEMCWRFDQTTRRSPYRISRILARHQLLTKIQQGESLVAFGSELTTCRKECLQVRFFFPPWNYLATISDCAVYLVLVLTLKKKKWVTAFICHVAISLQAHSSSAWKGMWLHACLTETSAFQACQVHLLQPLLGLHCFVFHPAA